MTNVVATTDTPPDLLAGLDVLDATQVRRLWPHLNTDERNTLMRLAYKLVEASAEMSILIDKAERKNRRALYEDMFAEIRASRNDNMDLGDAVQDRELQALGEDHLLPADLEPLIAKQIYKLWRYLDSNERDRMISAARKLAAADTKFSALIEQAERQHRTAINKPLFDMLDSWTREDMERTQEAQSAPLEISRTEIGDDSSAYWSRSQ